MISWVRATFDACSHPTLIHIHIHYAAKQIPTRLPHKFFELYEHQSIEVVHSYQAEKAATPLTTNIDTAVSHQGSEDLTTSKQDIAQDRIIS